MMRKEVPFTKEEATLWREKYPTPFYVYDEQGIRNTVLALREAFAWAPGYREYFAVKALPNPEILRILQDCGCGADCASISEVTLCRKIGMTGEDMIFTSNETTAEEYRTAKQAGAILNLDDITHIDFVEEVCGLPDIVCLRYHPGQFRIANDIMGKQSDSKFGMTPGQVLEACRILEHKGVRRFGLHAMLASCSLEESYYPRLAEELFSFAVKVREETGVVFELIDLAGGIGIPYRPEESQVDILAVGEGVRKVYEKILTPAGLAPKLATELGRYVTGPHGYLVTSVLHHKHTYKEYVGVDATACNLMRPAMYGAYHHITVLGKENLPADTVVDVVGSLCENNDKFAVDRPLPAVERGDLLVIHDAGAHGYSMGYNYNGKLRCAEFLLRRGHTIQRIRRAETLEDYFATLDIDPAFGDGHAKEIATKMNTEKPANEMRSRMNTALSGARRSAIREFSKLARQTPGCIALTLGEPDRETAPVVSEQIRVALSEKETHYIENNGTLALRTAIAEFEANKNGMDYSPDEVIVTAGATEALFIALFGILNPGDEVIVPMPAFVLYEEIIRLCRGVVVPLETAEDGFQLSYEKLQSLVTPHTKAILLNSPNNPTGVVYDRESLDAVHRVVSEHPLFVICDDVYRQLIYTDSYHSFAEYRDVRDRILVAQSFSKPYAMTGWRMGYLLADREIKERLELIHQYLVVSTPSLFQRSGIRALQTAPDEFVTACRRRQDFVLQSLAEMGLPVTKPEGAFYVFPDISAFGISSADFCRRMISEVGLAATPGFCFGSDDHIRLSVCASDENLREGMHRLRIFLEHLRQEKGEKFCD